MPASTGHYGMMGGHLWAHTDTHEAANNHPWYTWALASGPATLRDSVASWCLKSSDLVHQCHWDQLCFLQRAKDIWSQGGRKSFSKQVPLGWKKEKEISLSVLLLTHGSHWWRRDETENPGQEQEVGPQGMEWQGNKVQRVHWLSDCISTHASQDMLSNALFDQNASHRPSLPNKLKLLEIGHIWGNLRQGQGPA